MSILRNLVVHSKKVSLLAVFHKQNSLTPSHNIGLSVLQFAGTKRQIAQETTLSGPNLEWKQQKAQKSLNAAKQQRQKNAGGECQRGDICKSHQTLNSCHDDDDEYDDNGEHDNNNDNDDDDNDRENDDYGGRRILSVNMKEETCVNPARL